MVWGLRGMDTRGIDKWNPDDRGNVMYDNMLNITSIAAQEFLLEVNCPFMITVGCRSIEVHTHFPTP